MEQLKSQNNLKISEIKDLKEQIKVLKSARTRLTRKITEISDNQKKSIDAELLNKEILRLENSIADLTDDYQKKIEIHKKEFHNDKEKSINEFKVKMEADFELRMESAMNDLRNQMDDSFLSEIDAVLNENKSLKNNIDDLESRLENSDAEKKWFEDLYEKLSSESEFNPDQMNSANLNRFPFFNALNFIDPSDDIIFKEMDNPDRIVEHICLLNSVNSRGKLKGKKSTRLMDGKNMFSGTKVSLK